MFDDYEPKMKEPEKIIEVINEYDFKKMVQLYIYKIIFGQNKLDGLLNPRNKEKYKLEKYDSFDNFIHLDDEKEINYKFQTLDYDNYENIYKIIEKHIKENLCVKENFKKKIKKEEIDNDNLNIDNFYIASLNLILSHLKEKDFEQSDIYVDFYKNICEPVFDKNKKKKLSDVIQFFFNPDKYKEIQRNYGINSVNIESLFYGYRYCLSELSDENENGIYSTLYDEEFINFLLEKCYPGSDAMIGPYYELYFKVTNHFLQKKKEDCYVCLCTEGYYYSAPSDFKNKNKEIKCPHCSKDIGVKRDGFFRIFMDDEKIDQTQEFNYMTLSEFKERHIPKSLSNEKGLPKIDKDYFEKDNKIVRNLSQISYRLLNYILYSHLFFARLYTKKDEFNEYIPKGMNWIETLNDCWNLLKNELSKEKINNIDIFINYTFKDLFNKLHARERIDNYDDLIEYEKELDQFILEKIKLVKKECEKYNNLMNEDNEDKKYFMNLLKEKYESQNYIKKDYPFYENFYYSYYLNENNISEKLHEMDENKYNKYLLLRKYLEFKIGNKDNNNDDYSLDYLNLFNTVLNLFYEKYSHQLTRKFAEKKLLKDDEIYKNESNKELIDEFIKYYNKLKRSDSNGNIIELKADKNYLCDFVLDESNEIGKTYIDIYKKFIKKQNDEIESLLEAKIFSRVLDISCTNKINIQQIKEGEIFTFNAPKRFSFINVVFNSSYRKIIDTNKNYEIYSTYEIIWDTIEETMTDLLLKNKKLLNEDIIEFSYKDEIFSNEVNDLITSFNHNYNSVEIDSDDKKVLDKFFKDNEINKIKCKYLINDFITLLQYLNDLKKDKDSDITEESKISEVLELLKDNISKDFIVIFQDLNDELKINKISELFKYFIELIFKYVKEEIKNYQEILEEEMEDLDDDIINDLDDKKKKLDEYYCNKKALLSKKDFASAIQMFMTIVLFREKDKKNKIKNNCQNIINYLKAPDFWDNKIYTNEKFKKSMYELKIINIQINQIIWLYNYLVKNKSEKKDKKKERKKKKNDDKKKQKDEKNEIDNAPAENIIEVAEIKEEEDNDEGENDE